MNEKIGNLIKIQSKRLLSFLHEIKSTFQSKLQIESSLTCEEKNLKNCESYGSIFGRSFPSCISKGSCINDRSTSSQNGKQISVQQ